MKKITIYKSFREQEENEIEASLKTTPQQRILHVVELIRRIYPISKSGETKKIQIHHEYFS